MLWVWHESLVWCVCVTRKSNDWQHIASVVPFRIKYSNRKSRTSAKESNAKPDKSIFSSLLWQNINSVCSFVQRNVRHTRPAPLKPIRRLTNKYAKGQCCGWCVPVVVCKTANYFDYYCTLPYAIHTTNCSIFVHKYALAGSPAKCNIIILMARRRPTTRRGQRERVREQGKQTERIINDEGMREAKESAPNAHCTRSKIAMDRRQVSLKW